MNNSSCSSWVDHVEDHEDSLVGISILIICILTILAELVLFGLILSEKDLRRQVNQSQNKVVAHQHKILKQ